MQHDEIEGWAAVDAGTLPLDWELWSIGVECSDTLTESGKAAVRRAVTEIAAFLGPGFLEEARKRHQVEFMAAEWWGNEAPHRYMRLLALGARLELAKTCDGRADLRRAMAGSPAYLAHGLVQLEVAGHALRDGWTVRFEPLLTTGRSADLRLTRGDDKMLVEVKGVQLSKITQDDIEASRMLGIRLMVLSGDLGVTITGQLGCGVATLDQDEAVARLRSAAERAVEHREPVEVEFGDMGSLTVLPEAHVEGAGHGVGIRQADEWGRMVADLDEKFEQGAGDEPLWVRMDESSTVWAMAVPYGQARLPFHEQLAAALVGEMGARDHVGGIVLSHPPSPGNRDSVSEARTLDGRGVSMIVSEIPPYMREVLMAPGPHPAGLEQIEHWRRWYSDEIGWLAWALDETDQVPLSEAFVLGAVTGL
jgi:hypothetical protein